MKTQLPNDDSNLQFLRGLNIWADENKKVRDWVLGSQWNSLE